MSHEMRRPGQSPAVRSEAVRWGRLMVHARPGGRFARAPLGRFDRTARHLADARLVPRRAGETLDRPSAATIVVRALRADDADALVRMHARCSAASRHRRYFAVNVPEQLIRRLATADEQTCTGTVAAVGTEVVGVAHCCTVGDGIGEFAILVEDAYQRRGIGVALTRRLLDTTAHLSAVHALTQADNRAVARLLGRAGYTFQRRFQEGLVRLDIDLEPGRRTVGPT